MKTSFSKEGFFDVSSQLKDGTSYKVRLYPSCGSAQMVYIAKPGMRAACRRRPAGDVTQRCR